LTFDTTFACENAKNGQKWAYRENSDYRENFTKKSNFSKKTKKQAKNRVLIS